MIMCNKMDFSNDFMRHSKPCELNTKEHICRLSIACKLNLSLRITPLLKRNLKNQAWVKNVRSIATKMIHTITFLTKMIINSLTIAVSLSNYVIIGDIISHEI